MRRKLTLFILALSMGWMNGTMAVSDGYDDNYRYLVLLQHEDVVRASEPKTITREGFDAFNQYFSDLSDSEVKIATTMIFSYLRYDAVVLKKSLKKFLMLASETDTPVLIKFDGENWWDGRPDLWNWWDPDAPGYNPENRNNVEWAGWNSDRALKIAWRNWGRQLRVAPPPNLMSPAFRQAGREGMDELMPIIMDWWKGLPANKKHLFVGINVGWEASIGLNAYYYPNGNDLIDQPPENDPKFTAIPEDVRDRGKVQIGYAALKTAGIRSSGDITEHDLYEVVRRHLEGLSKYMSDYGFPREKIFTHGTGDFDEKLFDAALNEYASPSWSSYRYAHDPAASEGILRGIGFNDAKYWGIAEWWLHSSKTQEAWESALEKTLFYPGFRFLGVYHWKGISENPEAIEAIREVMKNHPE